MSLALPTAQPDGELILPHQLPLLLQVHLDTGNILVKSQQDQAWAAPDLVSTVPYGCDAGKEVATPCHPVRALEEEGLHGIAREHIRLK